MPKMQDLDSAGPTPASGGDKPETQLATPMTAGQKSTNETKRYSSGKPIRGAGSLGGKNRG